MKEKCQKFYPDFCNEVDSLDHAALKARVVQLQQHLAESEFHKEANDELKQARAEVAVLNGPYQDTKNAVKIKTAYLIEILSNSQPT